MLQSEVADLGAPAECERGQGRHRRQVPDADVGHVDTPADRALGHVTGWPAREYLEVFL